MGSKKRIHLPRQQTTEQQAREAELRAQFQQTKPSLSELVESGEYLPPISVGDYFDLAALLVEMKNVRLQAGMSLREYADASGVDFAALSRLENGVATNPTIQTLARCARALKKRIEIKLVDDTSSVPKC